MRSSPKLLVAFAALVAGTCWAQAADGTLLGCWKAARIVQFIDAEPVAEDTSGRCTLEFKAGQVESRCRTASNGWVVTTSSFRITQPGHYVATMISSVPASSVVGSTREYEFQVDGDRLQLVTYPQSKTPKPPAKVVRVLSESARVPCVAP